MDINFKNMMRDIVDLMLWLFIRLKAKLYKSIVASKMIFKEEISFPFLGFGKFNIMYNAVGTISR